MCNHTSLNYRLTAVKWHDIHCHINGGCCLSMQKKIKLISNILASTVLLLALAPKGFSTAQPAPTSLSISLLRLPCVNRGIGNWARREQDVSVGKAFYTSKLFMGPGNTYAALTCRLQPNGPKVIFQKLNLSFGMRDDDQGSPSAIVNVYLDGRTAESRSVAPGRRATVALDVSSTNNVSLEVVCSSQSRYCDRVYFWDADLTYPPLPPIK